MSTQFKWHSFAVHEIHLRHNLQTKRIEMNIVYTYLFKFGWNKNFKDFNSCTQTERERQRATRVSTKTIEAQTPNRNQKLNVNAAYCLCRLKYFCMFEFRLKFNCLNLGLLESISHERKQKNDIFVKFNLSEVKWSVIQIWLLPTDTPHIFLFFLFLWKLLNVLFVCARTFFFSFIQLGNSLHALSFGNRCFRCRGYNNRTK